MHKEDLALNILQELIYHKTQPNQIIYIQYKCIKRIWHQISYESWYAIKPNQIRRPNLFIVKQKENLDVSANERVKFKKTWKNILSS